MDASPQSSWILDLPITRLVFAPAGAAPQPGIAADNRLQQQAVARVVLLACLRALAVASANRFAVVLTPMRFRDDVAAVLSPTIAEFGDLWRTCEHHTRGTNNSNSSSNWGAVNNIHHSTLTSERGPITMGQPGGLPSDAAGAAGQADRLAGSTTELHQLLSRVLLKCVSNAASLASP